MTAEKFTDKCVRIAQALAVEVDMNHVDDSKQVIDHWGLMVYTRDVTIKAMGMSESLKTYYRPNPIDGAITVRELRDKLAAYHPDDHN